MKYLLVISMIMLSCQRQQQSEADAMAAKSIQEVARLSDARASTVVSCSPTQLDKQTTLYPYECIDFLVKKSKDETINDFHFDFLVKKSKDETINDFHLASTHNCVQKPCQMERGRFGCQYYNKDDYYILWMKESSESCPPALDDAGDKVWNGKPVRKY